MMYEMVLKEARKNKKPRPSSATSAWNLDDIMRKMKVKSNLFIQKEIILSPKSARKGGRILKPSSLLCGMPRREETKK